MSRRNPLYILWPLIVIFLPSLLVGIFVWPRNLERLWQEWNFYGILFDSWPHTAVDLFSMSAWIACLVYFILTAALVWWLRRPNVGSGLALFMGSALAGPSSFTVLQIFS